MWDREKGGVGRSVKRDPALKSAYLPFRLPLSDFATLTRALLARGSRVFLGGDEAVTGSGEADVRQLSVRGPVRARQGEAGWRAGEEDRIYTQPYLMLPRSSSPLHTHGSNLLS